MADFTGQIQKALDYMESHMTQPMEIREIAKQACLSSYYFQRIFTALCGVSVGEYLRSRRLTLAAEDLAAGEAKVIEVAAKYGYASPDSFNRAFQKFHGFVPSAARKPGAHRRMFRPITLTQEKENGSMLEFRIEEKPGFAVAGVFRKFHPETSYQRIPEYWTEMMAKPGFPLMGTYGVCIDDNGPLGEFDYWIADDWAPGEAIPEACRTLAMTAGTWAVFPCKMKTLQDTNTRMWQQWLPNCREYRLRENYNIEYYGLPGAEDWSESDVELWLPVERK